MRHGRWTWGLGLLLGIGMGIGRCAPALAEEPGGAAHATLLADAQRIYSAVEEQAVAPGAGAGAAAGADAAAEADGDARLDRYFRAAWRAAAGSGGGTAADAVRGARASLVALAHFSDPQSTLLKNPFVGPALAGVETADQRTAKRTRLGTPTLRGRSDWVLHFLVSAALAVTAGENAARLAGIQKEMGDMRGLSAGRGSGFSFGDLCANEAGIRFARWLAADPERTAARLGPWSERFAVADFFPDARDLPENLTEKEFAARWGGVGQAPYEEFVAGIRKRIGECAGYKP
ncbi:MAG: hypothetical protein HZA54_00910 [Planctomycetes bacterium]|nr:hypothetical protein [Planctomycetota bacterium]